MQDVGAAELLEHLARRAAGRTAAAKAEFARRLLGGGHQVHHVFVRRVGAHHQYLAAFAQTGDGREVFHRVVAELFVQVLVGRVGGVGGDEHGVAVRCGLGHLRGGDHAAGAALVVHDHRLFGLVTHRLAQRTRELVGGAARGKGHDEGDGFAGVGLGMGELGQGRGGGQGQAGGQQAAAGGSVLCHGLSPVGL